MKITYRKITPAEALAFRQIRLKCIKEFPEKFGSTYEDEADMPKLFFEELIERDLPDSFFFGAYCEDKLVAIAGFLRSPRTKTRHRGEIASMYVDPICQGQGVGTNLLKSLLEAAFAIEGIESVELSVVDDNTAAVRLYESLGFETYGVRPQYFKTGDKYWDQRFMYVTREKAEEILSTDKHG